jgi:hypothetical protein
MLLDQWQQRQLALELLLRQHVTKSCSYVVSSLQNWHSKEPTILV